MKKFVKYTLTILITYLSMYIISIGVFYLIGKVFYKGKEVEKNDIFNESEAMEQK